MRNLTNECCCCNETKDLTLIEDPTLDLRMYLCQKHLARHLGNKKEDSKEIQYCCGTQINSNGHCRICGDKY